MPCTCDIILNNKNFSDVVYSGQELSGTAVVITKKPKIVKGIHIIIRGYAKIKWQQGQFNIFNEERRLIGTQIYLRGNEDSKEFSLSPGIHEFPFHFCLPANLPSSIKSNIGRIHYKLILTVVNPLAMNVVFVKPFKVEYPLDLNSDTSYRHPICHTSQCSSWWHLYGPHIIRIKFETKTTGFQIGEALRFHLVVENDTIFECRDITVRLRQLVHHLADGEVNTIRTTIAEKSLGSIAEMSVQKYEDSVNIPPTEPSSTDTCDILQVGYKIQITVKTPRLHEDVVMFVPIVLGVVPFGGNLIDIVDILVTKL